jgi:thiosulfate dehydrogenase [quinone] large subunit
MLTWIRSSRIAASVLMILRMYVGWKFLSAGWGKLMGPEPFNAMGFLKGAIGKASGERPAVQEWYAVFLEDFVLPNVSFFNFLVPVGELLVGIGLLLGVFTTFSALMAALLNFNFLFAGTISVNPNLVIIEFFLLAAGFNAGRYGLDYYVIPFIRKYTQDTKQMLQKGA